MGELVAVDQEQHQQFGWKPHPNYEFAAADQVVPALPRELHVLACHYPLVFIKSEDSFVPMALLGIYPSQNLCVDSSGQWMKSYVPRYYEFTPFRLARNQNAALVICIDTECLVAHGASELPLFTPDGEPAAKVKAISQCLAQQHQELELARKMASRLADYNLLVPWDPKLVLPSTKELTLKGLYKVDEEKIGNLGDNAAGQLSRNSALYLAYCQLISMQHLQALADQLGVRQSRAVSSIDTLDRNGTISFDNF